MAPRCNSRFCRAERILLLLALALLICTTFVKARLEATTTYNRPLTGFHAAQGFESLSSQGASQGLVSPLGLESILNFFNDSDSLPSQSLAFKLEPF